MNEADRIILLGAGGHARVVAEAACLSGLTIAGYVAPEAASGDDVGMLGPYLGDDGALPALLQGAACIALAIGFVNSVGALRRGRMLGGVPAEKLATIVHPRAIISPSARLGVGSFVAAGAILGVRCRTESGVILNTGAVVDHDCRLGANCHVATGARVTGGVVIGRNVLIGAGATIRQGVSIADGAVIGVGAVVVRDVAAGVTVVGVPARPFAR